MKTEQCERCQFLLIAVRMLKTSLEGFQLGHEHAPDLPHTRAMGDTYGWCDYCQTKVSWGPGDAEEALAQLEALGAGEEK